MLYFNNSMVIAKAYMNSVIYPPNNKQTITKSNNTQPAAQQIYNKWFLNNYELELRWWCRENVSCQKIIKWTCIYKFYYRFLLFSISLPLILRDMNLCVPVQLYLNVSYPYLALKLYRRRLYENWDGK